MKNNEDIEKKKNRLDEDDEYISKRLSYHMKNHLITKTKDELANFPENKESYYEFLGLLSILLKEDRTFLVFLPVAIENIQYTINYNRYKFNSEGKIIDLENEIIIYLNNLRQDSTEEFREKYREMQRECRMMNFKTDTELLESIAYDSYLIASLKMNNLEDIEDDYFIASTTYLLDEFPELYQKNKNYLDMTIERINNIKQSSNRNRLQKRKVKIIKKQIEKI